MNDEEMKKECEKMFKELSESDGFKELIENNKKHTKKAIAYALRDTIFKFIFFFFAGSGAAMYVRFFSMDTIDTHFVIITIISQLIIWFVLLFIPLFVNIYKIISVSKMFEDVKEIVKNSKD